MTNWRAKLTMKFVLFVAMATILQFQPATGKADPAGALLIKLQRALQTQNAGKVIIVVCEDARSLASVASRAESNRIAGELQSSCQAAGSEVIRPSGELPDLGSVTAAPNPANLRRLLASENADFILAGVWQTKNSGQVLRLTLLNDRKVLWSWRRTLEDVSVERTIAKSRSPRAKSQRGVPGDGSAKAVAANGTDPNSSPITTGPGSLPLAKADTTTLNGKILAFASTRLGQQVGDGIGMSLAEAALQQSGAQTLWSSPEVSLTDMKPGDVLFAFDVRVQASDGSWWVTPPGGHVAIVGAVEGTKVALLLQNNDLPQVQQVTFDFATRDATSPLGRVTIYRAVPK